MKLPYYRYEEIKYEVVSLFDKAELKLIPVDVCALAKFLNIKLIKFSELPPNLIRAALALSNEGGLKFKMVDNQNNENQCILYNNSHPIGRQRFSILHEIGHVVLGHKQDSVLADAEADFFAKYAIAPPMLIDLIKPSDFMDVANAFGLSKECAYNSMNYYDKWSKITTYSEYEYRLIEMFSINLPGGGRVLRVS